MKNQYMPLFLGDFFANTLHLTAQEAGAYLFLFGHAWEHDANIAVCDLQRVARISNYHWPKIKARLEPFFSTTKVVNFWHHERVSQELAKAAEISNKRKEAAMQMHSKRTSNGNANGSHLYYTNNRDAFFGEGSKEPTPENPPAEPKPVAEKKNPRDPGLDYRNPPKTKSDNVLEPIPERPAFRRP